MQRSAGWLACFVFIACGGDSGGNDNGNSAADASIDAPSVEADAATDAPAGSAFLGQSCMGDGTCPTGYDCVAQDVDGPGYCSLACGTSPVLGVRPEEGDKDCSDAFAGSAGTPLCAMPVALGPPVEWFCAIDCVADDMCPTT